MITEIKLHLDADLCPCTKQAVDGKIPNAVRTGVSIDRSQEPPVVSYRIECLKCGAVLLARVDKTPGNVRIDR